MAFHVLKRTPQIWWLFGILAFVPTHKRTHGHGPRLGTPVHPTISGLLSLIVSNSPNQWLDHSAPSGGKDPGSTHGSQVSRSRRSKARTRRSKRSTAAMKSTLVVPRSSSSTGTRSTGSGRALATLPDRKKLGWSSN